MLEGFVSPSGLPGGVKLLVGLATGVVLYTYLLLGGRGADDRIEGAEAGAEGERHE
jgi:hypothetical protein